MRRWGSRRLCRASDRVVRVKSKGQICLKGKIVFIGEGLAGQQVAIRLSSTDGVLDVDFSHKRIRQIDLRDIA